MQQKLFFHLKFFVFDQKREGEKKRRRK